MTDVPVFLAGEGRNELGSRAADPVYQSDDEPGVLVALLRRVQADGWSVGGARTWKKIRKLKAHGPTHAEIRNIAAVALDAREAGCDCLAFIRDSDGDADRVKAIEEGIARLSDDPAIIGGACVPTLEAWILALQSERATQSMSPTAAHRRLAERGIDKDTAAMVAVIEGAALDRVLNDALSLRTWLARAEGVLPKLVVKAK